MNKILLYIILLSLATGLTAQDNSEYMMVMVKQKKAFKMARNEQDFQGLANTFERIANAETDQWHPLYYAGLCYINMSLVTDAGSQKDTYLDKAQTFIDKALEIYPDESELYVLQGLLFQGRIQVAPEERGQVYSMKASEALNLAKDYNPDNPRVYYLLGLNEIFIAQSTGGDLDKACLQFKTAVDKFKNPRPQHVLSPTWGGERNQMYYSRYCVDQN